MASEWYLKKLTEYLELHNPDKPKFNPVIIEINDKRMIFGIQNYPASYSIHLKTLDDFHTQKMKKVYARLFGDSQLMENLLEDDEWNYEEMDMRNLKDVFVNIHLTDCNF